jgi:hypothetical protein
MKYHLYDPIIAADFNVSISGVCQAEGQLTTEAGIDETSAKENAPSSE